MRSGVLVDSGPLHTTRHAFRHGVLNLGHGRLAPLEQFQKFSSYKRRFAVSPQDVDLFPLESR